MINRKTTLHLILLFNIFAVSAAYFIEYILGHQPCNLCVLERIPYLLALIIIVLNYKFINLEKYFILSLILIFLAVSVALSSLLPSGPAGYGGIQLAFYLVGISIGFEELILYSFVYNIYIFGAAITLAGILFLFEFFNSSNV